MPRPPSTAHCLTPLHVARTIAAPPPAAAPSPARRRGSGAPRAAGRRVDSKCAAQGLDCRDAARARVCACVTGRGAMRRCSGRRRRCCQPILRACMASAWQDNVLTWGAARSVRASSVLNKPDGARGDSAAARRTVAVLAATGGVADSNAMRRSWPSVRGLMLSGASARCTGSQMEWRQSAQSQQGSWSVRGSVYGMQTTPDGAPTLTSARRAKRIAEQRAAAKLHEEHRAKEDTTAIRRPAAAKTRRRNVSSRQRRRRDNRRQLKEPPLPYHRTQEEASAEEQAVLAQQRKLDADAEGNPCSVGV